MAEPTPEPASCLERPIFIVSPPASGESLLGAAMLASPGTWHAGEKPGALLAGGGPLVEGDLAAGNRLGAERADAAAQPVRDHLVSRYEGLDMRGLPGDATPRLFDATPRNSLRVPFLASVFPDSLFIYISRDPAEAISESLAIWESGKAVTYAKLEGWTGPPWSLLLVPGWEELAGLPMEEVVVEQWTRSASVLLDDLEALGGERWCVADYQALLNRPEDEVQRLFGFVGIGWHSGCSQPFRAAAQHRAAIRRPAPSAALAELLPRADPVAERAREWIGREGAEEPASKPGALETHDEGLGVLLKRLRSSLLVSTYHTDRLIALRWGEGALNAHLRSFRRPMGIAVHEGGFALGARAEVLDYRDFPAVAEGLEPKGAHDACYMPRNTHYTGDIAIHDLEFTGGELWLVATRFSCLATLDAEHSFVPRWKPPFVSRIAGDDRCHLNGLASVDGAPRYVTALGVSDEPGGWRENKATGGVVIHVPSGEVVLDGLSMPHSPRWHDGRLWLLESGKGSLAVWDPESGELETVAEMPGFTRGLAFSGSTAFVGLSQIRETATFGGLPIAELDRRECGVWAVNTDTGEIKGFLRFEDTIQEIFDVALLAGVRFPDIAEEGSPVAESSWFLPRQI